MVCSVVGTRCALSSTSGLEQDGHHCQQPPYPTSEDLAQGEAVRHQQYQDLPPPSLAN